MAEGLHIVLCEKRYPFPANHGRAFRITALGHILRRLGFRVTFLVGHGESKVLPDGTRIDAVPLATWPLREIQLLLELRRIHREDPVDYLQIQNDVFVLLGLLARITGFSVTYDAQVVEAAFWSPYARRSIWDFASSKAMPLCERLLCRISERISTLSAEDARGLEAAHRMPPGKVVVVPLSSPTLSGTASPREASDDARPIVLFLGSYAHRPNADAIALIEREVRSRVVQAIPTAVFQIVGQGLPVERLNAAGLEAHSDVRDVTPFIDAAAVCLAPIQVGSGVRIKLLEYMARGKPVVAMSPAVEGLALRPGIDLVVADDLDLFADSIVALLKDPALRHRFGAAGLERIRGLASEEAAANALRTFYPRASS
jgi:glycosyltransferase involved in cell wall biosynthesis